ncbi:CPBP family intramembrane metalloprotease domain-containing protein, partial [Leptolyngbya sp. FACHB-36]|nr:CPBP family intramembrane metalloprotease domain-containing protein [Leptolyngbya sp. FACHB-36]
MSTFVKSLLEAPAPLTIGAFFVVWVLMWLPLAIPLAIVLQWRPPNVPTVAQKIPLVLSLYAIAPLLLWWTAHLTGASFSQYGFTPTASLLTSLAAGLGLGVLGVVLLFGLETGLGWIAWQPS